MLQGWPTVINYHPVAFVDLAQGALNTWVDIVGIVNQIGQLEQRSIKARDGRPGYIMKVRRVQLVSGDFHEDLDLLGKAADTPCRIGDVLAVHKCKPNEYNNRRALSTGLLTFLENNPSNKTVPPPQHPDGAPTKKATRSNTLAPLPVVEVQVFIQVFLDDYQAERAAFEDKRNCLVIGKYRKFDEGIFASYPFHGQDNAPEMKITGVIYDNQGELKNVTFWNDAAQELFPVDAATLLGIWEGCEDPEQKKIFLDTLNTNTKMEFKFCCRMKLFQPSGGDRARARVDINVDTVEPLIDED
jgi:hypothetical protein